MIKNANISETVQDIDIVTTAATAWAKKVSHKLLKIYILQGSVATQLRCSGIFNNHFILKIGQNLAKIWIRVAYFLAHPVHIVCWLLNCAITNDTE